MKSFDESIAITNDINHIEADLNQKRIEKIQKNTDSIIAFLENIGYEDKPNILFDIIKQDPKTHKMFIECLNTGNKTEIKAFIEKTPLSDISSKRHIDETLYERYKDVLQKIGSKRENTTKEIHTTLSEEKDTIILNSERFQKINTRRSGARIENIEDLEDKIEDLGIPLDLISYYTSSNTGPKGFELNLIFQNLRHKPYKYYLGAEVNNETCRIYIETPEKLATMVAGFSGKKALLYSLDMKESDQKELAEHIIEKIRNPHTKLFIAPEEDFFSLNTDF